MECTVYGQTEVVIRDFDTVTNELEVNLHRFIIQARMLLIRDERLVDQSVDEFGLTCVDGLLRRQESIQEARECGLHVAFKGTSADLYGRVKRREVQFVDLEVQHALFSLIEHQIRIDVLSCHFWSHVVHGLEIIERNLSSSLNVANLVVKDQIYLVNFVD